MMKRYKDNVQQAEAYYDIGQAKYALGQYEEAIKDYDEAIKCDKQYAEAYYNRGRAKYALERYEEAIKDYDEAIKCDKQYAEAYYNRGRAKYALERYEEAIKDYDEAIEIDREYAEAYYNRGQVKYFFGQYEEAKAEAKEDYEKAIKTKCKNIKDGYGKARYYKFRPINKNTIEMLVNKQVYFSDIASLNDPLECPMYESIFEDKSFTPYILSFTVSKQTKEFEYKPDEIVNNTLLFSHYADNHRGICIEYEMMIDKDKIDKVLSEEGKEKDYILYAPVKYSNDKIDNKLEDIFAIKDKQWKYENEGRFILFSKNKPQDSNGKFKEGLLSVTKIIFGLKTSSKDKKLLCKLLNTENGNKDKICFFQAKPQKGKYFNIEFSKLTEEEKRSF